MRSLGRELLFLNLTFMLVNNFRLNFMSIVWRSARITKIYSFASAKLTKTK